MARPWIRQAWAKLDAEGGLSLCDHAADVAAVLEQLLREGAYVARPPFARLFAEDPALLDRLCVLAGLHDLGKANRGFWSRQHDGSPRIGHTEVTAALFEATFADARPVGRLTALIVAWKAQGYFMGSMAHHGRPLRAYSRDRDDEAVRAARQWWHPTPDYDPMAELDRLLDRMGGLYPQAFAASGPLPGDPRLVSLFTGLVTLADWLGSDVGHFPIGGPLVGARDSGARARRIVAARDLERIIAPHTDFPTVFGFAAHPSQVAAGMVETETGPLTVLEAETGSGKTEAALWRFFTLAARGVVDGLYFAVPTRTAAVQLHARVQRALNALFADPAPQAVLAVPGYLRAGGTEGQRLPGFDVLWPDEVRTDAFWAAEAPKQYLCARVAVGTVDQVLMSGLQMRHAHLRAAALSRSLLVVDEVHASDAFMTAVLMQVLENHLAAGGHAMLLSATLGGEARSALLGQPAPSLATALATPYPAIHGLSSGTLGVAGSDRAKPVAVCAVPDMNDPDAVAARAVEAAHRGASVLVIRNTVDDAVATAQAIESQAPDLAFMVADAGTLHHGRFAAEDRRLLDAAVECAFGKGRSAVGRILVGTQTLEQSLDLDADLLITDLAPIDVLLQRIGRLHRHPRRDRGDFARPSAVVLRPPARDLSPFLGAVPRRHGLGPLKNGDGVYPDLLVLEATLRLVEATPDWIIPRDNRRLVETVLHSEALQVLADELGTDWANHEARRAGSVAAERQQAGMHRLDFGRLFDELCFPQDEAVRTRLGAGDRLINLPAGTLGPFGQLITRLRVPGHMAQGIGGDPAVVVRREGRDLVIEVDAVTLSYGRWGLRRRGLRKDL